MQTASVADARRNFAELLNRAGYGSERTVVTRHGRPVCAIVPVADLELLQALEAGDAPLELRAALRELTRDGAVDWDTLRARLDGR